MGWGGAYKYGPKAEGAVATAASAWAAWIDLIRCAYVPGCLAAWLLGSIPPQGTGERIRWCRCRWIRSNHVTLILHDGS